MNLRVSVEEGHALEVLDLLCRGRAIRIVPEHPIEEPRPELTELAARRLAAASLRLLAESGRREQVILRQGRRVRGRIWDARRSVGFRLRFTAASFELWVQMTQRLADIARSAEVVDGQGATRRTRRQIRRIIKIADTDTGDWLLYALAYRNLGRADIPPEIRDDLRRRLALGSPLAALFALEDRVTEAGVTLPEYLGRLFDDAAAPLLECLEDLLAEQWVEQITACMRITPGDARTERLAAAATVLETFLRALDDRGRLDLCRPLCRALARLLAGAWGGEPEQVVQRIQANSGLIQLTQRDALRRALARLAALGEQLQELREELAREAFGDPRYEEAQLFLEIHDELLRPHARRLTALVSALTGRIG
jgi:hypothetical protein